MFFKNDVVYKQGQDCNKVYLILDGEFEQMKQTILGRDRTVQIQDYIGPKTERGKPSMHFRKMQKFTSNLNILSKGMLFGFDDAMAKCDKYTQTTRCKTDQSTVFWINKADFIQKVSFYSDTQSYLKERIAGKSSDIEIQDSINQNVFNFYKKNNNVIDKINQKGFNKVKSSEFFETMFGGDPIPTSKIERILDSKRDARLKRVKPGPVIISEPEKDCHHCEELVEKKHNTN